MGRLTSKVALVTGAAKGIGEATARLFVQEGASVIVTDIDSDLGQKMADDLNVQYLHLDVSKETDWEKVMQEIQSQYDRLDILVNNAGVTGLSQSNQAQDPERVTLEAWHDVHAVNLDGVMLGCKHAMGLMKSEGGSIVNMSSRSGMVGVPAAPAYASSKAAVRNHTKSVALYCAQSNYPIRCNSIHAGAILTPLWDDMLGTDDVQRQMAINAVSEEIPLGHMGEPMDVAYAALYLASDESKYVTGSELTIDGGILAGSRAAPK